MPYHVCVSNLGAGVATGEVLYHETRQRATIAAEMEKKKSSGDGVSGLYQPP